MSKSYYYTRTGQDVLGPVSEAQLFYMLGLGKLPASTQICAEGANEWHPIPLPPAIPGGEIGRGSNHSTVSTTAAVREESDLEFPKDKTAIAQGGVLGILGLLLVIAGIVLCFTLIGGILGLPMICGGVVLMVWGPALALGKPQQKTRLLFTGACPYCGHEVSFQGPLPGYTCPACGIRFVIRDREFVRVSVSATATASPPRT